MGNFKELRVFAIQGPDKVLVGAVRCPANVTFELLRKEIEMDDLVSYSFDFIILDSVLRTKQEARWQVHQTEVYIKQKQEIEPRCKRQCLKKGLKNDRKKHGLSLEQTPETGLDEVGDCESSNEKCLEAGKKVVKNLTDNQLQSKLVPSDILFRWECEVERVRARLKSRGREDKFDIYTRDEGGEVIIKVWCLECGRTYGSGKDPLTSAYRTLSNFHQSHIRSAMHRDNYATNHGVDPDALPTATMRTHKEEIEAAMLEVSNFNSFHAGASFEIVQLTLGNFSNKHHVFMRCTLDDQWLHLVPKCGTSTETIMLRHVQSAAHRVAAMTQKAQIKHAEDRKRSVGLGASSSSPNEALAHPLFAQQRCREYVKAELEPSGEASSEYDDGGSEGDDDSDSLLLSCSESGVDEFLSTPEASVTRPEESKDVAGRSLVWGSRTQGTQGIGNGSSSKLLATLCWGMWQPEVEIGDVVVAVKGLLADEKGGADWWAEPHVTTSVCSRGQEYKIAGCFRHRKCERVSYGKPFPSLCCSFCRQIPKCSDFRERALLRTRSPGT